TGGAERERGRDPHLLRTTGPDQLWPGAGSGDQPTGDDPVPGREAEAGAGDAGEDSAGRTGEGEAGERHSDDGGAGDGPPGGDDELARCRVERDEYLDSLRRLQAEFENYKKRVIKQQADQVARAAVSLLEKILPVLDTLDLAIEHMGDPGSVDGRALEAVSSQLRDVLGKEGLERISPIGEHFDPTAHEAVGHLPAEAVPDGETTSSAAVDGADGADGNAGADGAGGEPVVAEVMRAGYRWRGAVVRPAMVMV